MRVMHNNKKHITESMDTIIILHDSSQEKSVSEDSSSEKSSLKSLTFQEAKELAQFIKHNNLDADNFIWGLDSLKIINYVGYIRLSTVEIEILPKVSNLDPQASRMALLNILNYLGIFNVHISEISKVSDVHLNLFEIMGYFFADKLKYELTKGVSSSYISVENNSSIFRGKLVVNKQVGNMVRRNAKVYCRYDEFSINNRLNGIFKKVAKLLLNKINNPKTINLLRFCLSYFEEVHDSNVNHSDLDQVKFDRTNSRFKEVFSLAKLLWLQIATCNEIGRSDNFSLLFRMDKLFEQYIARLIKGCTDFKVKKQDATYYLASNKNKREKKHFLLEPDIVIEKENNKQLIQLIIDTKWKNIKKEKSHCFEPERDDYFQMNAYLTGSSSAKAAILLYPHNNDKYGAWSQYKQPLESYMIEGLNNKKLCIYTVDYESVEKTKSQLKQILKNDWLFCDCQKEEC